MRKSLGLITILAVMVLSCSKDGSTDYYMEDSGSGILNDKETSEGNGNSDAGILTAGEWSDLENWGFWCGLMKGDYSAKAGYWGFYPFNRVAVRITYEDKTPASNREVALLSGSETLWKTKTDNRGQAECWPGLFVNEFDPDAGLAIAIDGKTMEGKVAVTTLQDSEVKINRYTVRASNLKENQGYVSTASVPAKDVDIAFIVDATGSMTDEIDFLKEDLVDIISKAKATDVSFRTSALFYRDEGDNYLTDVQNFTENLNSTVEFIGNHDADGGGDYPEAVHTALEFSLQKLSWNENAHSRIAFMFLDAPAHHTDKILESLHKSIRTYAGMGIKLIPVAASGVDKNTEFMLRFFALSTAGTYVFLTNDSGVGGDHIEASVGKYKVETLNDLIVRLIRSYSE